MKKILILILVILVSGCVNDNITTDENIIIIDGGYIEENLGCNLDTDCVEASCCHADSCVNKDKAPNCEDVMCTMECKPGSLDCGQGSCKCLNGKCEAVFE